MKSLLYPPVIFVPGIKGSVLEQGGKRVWLSPLDVLHNTPPLMYHEGDGTHATGLLERLTLIPYLVRYNAYAGIAKMMRTIARGYIFTYDWREHIDANSEKFGQFVERVKAETGESPAIVAHSLGGLVAHGYVKQHPENIAKVVYISVPFRPGIGYFDDVNEGVSVGLNKTVLSKEAIFSHPATYYLLAHKGSNQYEGRDFFSAKEWQENKWSVFKDSLPDLTAFQKLLDRVAKYHKLLDKQTELNIPALIVTGQCFPTLERMTAKDERPKVPGDKRVSYASAFPYDTFASQIEKDFCVSHDRQMNDKRILNTIFEFILAI